MLTPEAGFDAVLHFAGLIAAGESMGGPSCTGTPTSPARWPCWTRSGPPGCRDSSSPPPPRCTATRRELRSPRTPSSAPTNTYGCHQAGHRRRDRVGACATSWRGRQPALLQRGRRADPPDGTALGERHDPETHLIPIALEVAAGKRDGCSSSATTTRPADGTCVRDYIHIEDLARAHLLALDAAKAGRHGIYNLGNGRGYSNREVVDVVRAVTGHPVPVETCRAVRATRPNWWPPPPGRAPSSAGCRPSRTCTPSSATRGSSCGVGPPSTRPDTAAADAGGPGQRPRPTVWIRYGGG